MNVYNIIVKKWNIYSTCGAEWLCGWILVVCEECDIFCILWIVGFYIKIIIKTTETENILKSCWIQFLRIIDSSVACRRVLLDDRILTWTIVDDFILFLTYKIEKYEFIKGESNLFLIIHIFVIKRNHRNATYIVIYTMNHIWFSLIRFPDRKLNIIHSLSSFDIGDSTFYSATPNSIIPTCVRVSIYMNTDKYRRIWMNEQIFWSNLVCL